MGSNVGSAEKKRRVAPGLKRDEMSPGLLELWLIALGATDSAVATAVRARVFSAHDAAEARRVLEDELRWLNGERKDGETHAGVA